MRGRGIKEGLGTSALDCIIYQHFIGNEMKFYLQRILTKYKFMFCAMLYVNFQQKTLIR